MLGPGSHERWSPARGRLGRTLAALVRGNHHVLFAGWLLVVVPSVGALAAHAYDRDNWLHWAHIVFFTVTPLALALAWAGERVKRSLR
jgi:hypothetical protein